MCSLKKCILHCDLNNFYASVECFYRPAIRNYPVAVCGSQEDRHGIVLAKNYIAKKYGIQTGEAIWQAKNKCPNLVVIKPDFQLYLNFSKAAKAIYKEYTDLVESFGIDECWLDVTQSTNLFGGGEKIAYIIKQRIKDELGITASIGVSFNKIFAKLGSDMKKPDAVTVIMEEDFKNLIWHLPVGELLYVGRATKCKLNKASIFTIGELATAPLEFLKSLLGKWGQTLWTFANGQDVSPVAHLENQSYIKSVGNSMTSPYDLNNNEEAKILIFVLAESVGQRLRKYGLKGKSVQISIKDDMLFCIERQDKLELPSFITYEIANKAYDIFLRCWNWSKNVRALGIRVSDLEVPGMAQQLSFLYDEEKRTKQENIDNCIDAIRERFGHYSVQRGGVLKDSKLNSNPIEENVVFPVSYFK